MKFVNIVNENSVVVIDTETGEQVKFYSDDSRYQTALNLLETEDYAAIFALDTKAKIKSFFESTDDYGEVKITIENGIGKVYLNGFGLCVPLNTAITNRIIKMSEQGFSCRPLINFIARLYSNPTASAVEELYQFIESCELPITENGCFIAYKIVDKNYKDIYSGTIDNSVGKTVEMPRYMVDADRSRTCSTGLHFCSRAYLPYYGTKSRDTDRCILVKIDPADVVSIPADYNNAKGRTWRYEVIGEMPAGWRATLQHSDFTDNAVVNISEDQGDYEEEYDVESRRYSVYKKTI